jgi:hypothetical protein
LLYSYFVKRLVRRSFDDVNSHRWDELLEAVPNVHHRFGGAHAIGGKRHDKENSAGLSASSASCRIST